MSNLIHSSNVPRYSIDPQEENTHTHMDIIYADEYRSQPKGLSHDLCGYNVLYAALYRFPPLLIQFLLGVPFWPQLYPPQNYPYNKNIVINRNVSSMHGISTLDGQLNPLILN